MLRKTEGKGRDTEEGGRNGGSLGEGGGGGEKRDYREGKREGRRKNERSVFGRRDLEEKGRERKGVRGSRNGLEVIGEERGKKREL